MEIFKITPNDEGKIFIIRPLINSNNIKESILSYKIRWGDYEWKYRHLCFALINDELKIFNLSDEMMKQFSIRDMLMDSNIAIKVTVKLKSGFLNNKYELIEDDKYKFDTDEKRKYIKTLLSDIPNLSDVLKSEKEKISHLTVELPSGKGEPTITTLKEIYEAEDKR